MSNALNETDIDLDDEIEIEIETEEPQFSRGEEDAGRPIAADDTTDEEDSEEELAQYSESVQKRIKRQTASLHAERRAKELAIKRADEILDVARKQQAQLAKEREQRLAYTRVAVNASRNNLEGQIASLQREAKEAMEAGDYDAQILAQTKLNAVVQQMGGMPDQATLDRDLEAERTAPMPQMFTAPSDAQAVYDTWIGENDWFNADKSLYQDAVDAENLLVQRHGMRQGARDTLDRVKAIVAAANPEKMAKYMTVEKSATAVAEAKKPATKPPGMPVVRSAPNGKRVVKLSQSQIDLATELGITPQQYAEEYARMNQG